MCIPVAKENNNIWSYIKFLPWHHILPLLFCFSKFVIRRLQSHFKWPQNSFGGILVFEVLWLVCFISPIVMLKEVLGVSVSYCKFYDFIWTSFVSVSNVIENVLYFYIASYKTYEIILIFFFWSVLRFSWLTSRLHFVAFTTEIIQS